MSQTTLDTLYGGALRLKQHKVGYRYGVDSIALVSFAKTGLARTLDLGAGVGVIALSLWREHKSARVVGIEVQTPLCQLAQGNVTLNQANGQIEVLQGDLRDVAFVESLGPFARVIMNPPYWPVHAGRLPPNEEKAIAKHKLLGGLDAWLTAAAAALPTGGVLEVVYPSERLPDLMAGVVQHRLTPVLRTMVHTRAGMPAALALLRCEKDGRTGLAVTEPWVIFGDDGVPHPRYQALAVTNGPIASPTRTRAQ